MSIQIPIKNLKQHPAQMRTVYDIESLAMLCLQIYERGLDEWQTLLASPNGEESSYFIVSGHRRRMARLVEAPNPPSGQSRQPAAQRLARFRVSHRPADDGQRNLQRLV